MSSTAADVRARSASLELGLLALLGVLWGTPYALTKIALETIPPLTLVAARVALAAAVLWAVVFALRRHVPVRPAFLRPLFVQGCLTLTSYTLITMGQQTVDSALAAVLNSTAPLFVCLITLVWTRHEPITPGRLLGVMIGLGGIVLIAGVGALNGLGRETIGQAAIVVATLLIALSAIHGRRFAAVAPEVTAAGVLTWSAVVLVPLCFLVEAPLSSTPSAASILALLGNAVVATAFGFVLYFRLVRTVGSMGIASVGYIKIGVGVIIGCALLGEPFTWTLAVGLAAVVVGVAAINRYGSVPESIAPGAAIHNNAECAGRAPQYSGKDLQPN
jgi:drug/metabolite transporter (DMT)-like permease